VSAQSKDNCPPQFVFEMMVSQAARRFLVEDKSAEDIVAEIVAAFEDLYSNDALVTDMIDGLERLFGFLQTVEIDDVDLLLVSYIWFVTNYESLRVERKKKQLFGNPLKGKPRLLARVYTMTTNFRTYTLSVAQKHAPFRPESWKTDDEVEFEAVFSRLFPKPKEPNKQA
jgi:hypothetical protein